MKVNKQRGVRSDFNLERLKTARKAKGWTMTRLADDINLTRQAISQYEKSDTKPSPEKLREIASSLGQPVQYFTWDTSVRKQSPATFRSLVSSAGRAREQAESWMEMFATIVKVFQKSVNIPLLSLPSIDIPDFTRLSFDDIEEIAIATRRHFRLGDGPISNLTLLLENHGILIAFKKLNKNLSGLSQWYDDRPFVLIEPAKSASRTRYSLSHELGHIILHQQITSDAEIFDKATFKLIEEQANYFAGAFMLPESTLAREVYGTDWDSMIELKSRWKMSIAALAMRLNNINIISDYQKTRIFRDLGSHNARTHEPLDNVIEQDSPRMIKRVAELLNDEGLVMMSDIPNIAPISVELLSELTQIPVDAMKYKSFGENVISIRR